ncbi:50S ribosomal protein L2 [candidate division WWE3 bacterium]|uniref:50S ribosomal protein L2 n=1 Tax=candidate division WWE3 bacterium TaxID=2053526 RepID=A0A7X9HSK6_UNCKA|nr:50S ribosomal protein L2 [candidate division WWE3 bacterium]
MIKTYRPTSEGLRTRKTLVKNVNDVRPYKPLSKGVVGPVGRSRGKVSSRHMERGARKLYRTVDFKRDKFGIPAKVLTIENDPNRGPNIALLAYKDGEKRYILAPEGLKVGMEVMSGKDAEVSVGNCLPMSNIPLGVSIHNVEVNPKAGGILVRGAGNQALIIAKEGDCVNVKLPSGEVKKVRGICYATIGVLGNVDKRNARLGKAGRKRHLGIRPHVRGVAMGDPHRDHPHAGKYRTSGIGMASPKSPWGWITRGVKTRRRVRTNYTIVSSRKVKK